MSTLSVERDQLKARWAELLQDEPRTRIRDAALRLGVSERELLETKLGGEVVALRSEWAELLGAMEPLGRVMALSRNEYAVHETKGVYAPVSIQGPMGTIVGHPIDLRFLLHSWDRGFAVEETAADGATKRSFQFFSADGEALHKIHLIEGSHTDAFAPIRDRFRSEDQSPSEVAASGARPKREGPLDQAGLLEGWRNLKDTHDFYPLLRRFQAERVEAFEAAEGEFTRRIEGDVHEELLTNAAKAGVPIMVFVANRGMVQIFGGEIHKVVPMHGWTNVMDPDFNLHLKDEGVAQTWFVRKPTEDGVVTSIELFDAEGRDIVTFFGKRKPGIPELETWRELAEAL